MSATETVLERPRTDATSVPAVEWPTLALTFFAYGGWLVLTRAYGEWPTWVIAPCTAVLLTLHSSLQHEILHGHPTRWAAVNRLLGLAPLSLWIPYDRFRTLHLKHHVNDRLTDPLDDPETNYVTAEDWQQRPTFARWMFQLQLTLAGRVLVGSWWRMGGFWSSEARAFARNEPGVRAAWVTHLILCVPVVYWVTVVCAIPFWLYVVAMVIPGNGILLIRSYAEHKARADMHQRTAVVEDSWVLGPVFLFNNLHSLHHAEPLLPWYRYQRRYRAIRDQLLAANGGLVYSTYFDVARRYLFRMHDQPQHPLGRAPGQRRG
ncbi:MAG: fatty acid desaturase [Gammaproteobacteria bacterium]|nr:fatty acid desaturase [Gammaproteobacteria bacterium]MDH5177493.1 fatty acid desaturase [Gammaproteobacteria bacterium]MDH5226393.1 fatty acid desaturase [Gammaproteobacteria bacterium]